MKNDNTMEFINRTSELNTLSEQYNQSGVSFVVIYGRRRTGKTTLISHFIKDKPAIYLLADKLSEKLLINRFKLILTRFFSDDRTATLELTNWDQWFEYLIEKIPSTGKKLIIAIDEFQYISYINEAFPSVLQRYWDEHLQHLPIMLIICGSHTGMMFKQALNYNSPLYGRRTAQIHLKAFSFIDYKNFFKAADNAKALEFNAVTGGIPKYALIFDNERSVFSNIRKNILDRDSLLFTEPRFILQEEVTETATYFSILEAIALGNHKIGHIAAKLGMNTNNLTNHLDKLRQLDIIERRIPMLQDNPLKSRKGLYFIKDYFFRFWFRFVHPYSTELEKGDIDFVERRIKAEFNLYVSKIFEEIIHQLAYYIIGLKGFKSGWYWDRNTEIDFLAINHQTEKVYVGECKWSNHLLSADVLNDLKQKVLSIDLRINNPDISYVIFAKNGFRKDIIKEANNNVILINFRDLVLSS